MLRTCTVFSNFFPEIIYVFSQAKNFSGTQNLKTTHKLTKLVDVIQTTHLFDEAFFTGIASSTSEENSSNCQNLTMFATFDKYSLLFLSSSIYTLNILSISHTIIESLNRLHFNQLKAAIFQETDPEEKSRAVSDFFRPINSNYQNLGETSPLERAYVLRTSITYTFDKNQVE